MASLEFFSKKSDGTVAKKIASAPVGAIFAWAKETPPEHCLECNGATLTTAAYPELGAVLAESGATSFTLPDLRGEFVRGWDHGRGVDSGRAIGTAQEDAFKKHRHGWAYTYSDASNVLMGMPVFNSSLISNGYHYETDDNTIRKYSAAIEAVGWVETRPRNVALMYVIVTNNNHSPGL